MDKYGLFLDDIRNPEEIWSDAMLEQYGITGIHWITARNTYDALELMDDYDFYMHSLDHDLGGDDTAMKFVHAIIDNDLYHDGHGIPDPFRYYVHSANPVGRANIEGLLQSYLSFKELRKKDNRI